MEKESEFGLKRDYLKAIGTFKSEPAVIKLLVLAKGINVDGKELAKKNKWIS